MTGWIVTSSVLIVVVAVLRALFRKRIGSRLQYAVWAIVLIRLLMPCTVFSSSFSILNLIDMDHNEITVHAGFQPEMNETGNGNETAVTVPGGEVYLPVPENNLPADGPYLLSVIWIAGSFIVGLWFIGANLVFYKKLRKKRQRYCFSECRLPVYVSGNIASPCLFGIPRPSVYLTPKATESETAVRNVIAHELCHYRHGDHIWSVMRGLCITVWWWNPLVWMAAFMSLTDSELACDEAVISSIGEDRRFEYGHTLVDMIAVRKPRVGLICAATSMFSGKRGVKERLDMIVKKPKVILPVLAAVVLIIAVSAACTFTGPKVNPAAKDLPDAEHELLPGSDGSDSHGTKLLTGYVEIKDNLLYLDEVEIVWKEDKERIKELGLTESDKIGGYYVYNEDTEKQVYELTDDTAFTFPNMGLAYAREDDDSKVYHIANNEDFIMHLDTSYNDSAPARKVPCFVEVKDGKVVSITEELTFGF